MRAAALLVALALPLTAARSEPADPDPFAGRVAGKPARCVALRQSDGPTIAADGVVILRRGAGRIWRANLIGPCPNLRPFNTVITEVYGGQLCRNDKFRVLEPNLSIPGPYCRFGSFTPYDLPKERSD